MKQAGYETRIIHMLNADKSVRKRRQTKFVRSLKETKTLQVQVHF